MERTISLALDYLYSDIDLGKTPVTNYQANPAGPQSGMFASGTQFEIISNYISEICNLLKEGISIDRLSSSSNEFLEKLEGFNLETEGIEPLKDILVDLLLDHLGFMATVPLTGGELAVADIQDHIRTSQTMSDSTKDRVIEAMNRHMTLKEVIRVNDVRLGNIPMATSLSIHSSANEDLRSSIKPMRSSTKDVPLGPSQMLTASKEEHKGPSTGMPTLSIIFGANTFPIPFKGHSLTLESSQIMEILQIEGGVSEFCLLFNVDSSGCYVRELSTPTPSTALQINRILKIQTSLILRLHHLCYLECEVKKHSNNLKLRVFENNIDSMDHHRRLGGQSPLNIQASSAQDRRLYQCKNCVIYEFEPSTEITVGRGSKNILQLNTTKVSTKHGKFKVLEGVWHYVDCKSTNGSWEMLHTSITHRVNAPSKMRDFTCDDVLSFFQDCGPGSVAKVIKLKLS